MNISKTDLDGVLIIEPQVFGDERGFFLETYHQHRYREFGINADFIQDNLSFSNQRTLRGLHFQHPNAQAKLVQVLQGEVFDVVADIRRQSPSFGRWTGEYLSEVNKKQIFIPEGFAHGFCVISDTALFHYKGSDFYASDCEGGIKWNDPGLAIDWPVDDPIVSEKDRALPRSSEIPTDRFPPFK
jgi:dTDP-4-dehydrorhamnose 3,5-epimerase